MFSDALDREAAWLATTGDSLPSLLAANGGPFQIVQARWPRVRSTRKTGIYVMRAPSSSAKVQRFAMQRSMLTTHFQLRLWWQLSNATGSGEIDQLRFDQAIDKVILRVQDLLGDHTHGGRFLSVAENPDYIDVDYDDPEHAQGAYSARITYSGDDPDFNN